MIKDLSMRPPVNKITHAQHMHMHGRQLKLAAKLALLCISLMASGIILCEGENVVWELGEPATPCMPTYDCQTVRSTNPPLYN